MEAEVPWEWDASVAPKAGSCEIATAPLAFFLASQKFTVEMEVRF